MAAPRTPAGLAKGGRALWAGVAGVHDLDVAQQVNLLEACRQKDRLDKLDELLRGESTLWARLTHRTLTEDYELVIDKAFTAALAAANQMKQHLAALRLPDALGDRPQQRGGARGAYGKGAPVPAPAPVADPGADDNVTDIRARLNGIA